MKKNSLMEKILFPRKYVNTTKLRNELIGKTILITGASSGIGKQLAYYLGDMECHLLLVARRKDNLLELQKTIKVAKVSIFTADLRDKDDMEEFLAFIQKLEHIDFFVNNAGISIKRSIYESLDRFHDFKRSMAINYFAPVEILLSIIPHLEKRKGQIINISTINTLLIPFPNFSAYQASKQAFDTWFRSVSPELNAKEIVTTSIYLPLVRTPMIEPTTGYQKMPAMASEHVAHIISQSMYKKRKRFKPWWIFGGQIISLLSRGLWERFGKLLMKKS